MPVLPTGAFRMKSALMLVLLGASMAAQARAELPPYVYEAERRAAGHVLVLSDVKVTAGIGRAPSGQCTLTGQIEAVERGGGLRKGEMTSIKLACITDAWRPMPGPFPGYHQDWLGKLARVRAFVNDGILVRKGLDPLEPAGR